MFEDFENAQKRMSNLMRQHYEIAIPGEIGKICDDVFNRYALAEDDPIPSDLLDSIIGELSERMACFATKVPYEETLSEAEIEKILKPKKE